MRWFEVLERPIISFFVMGIFSSVAAVIFFRIGGSVAKVTAEDNALVQATFEAGGALAGFIIIFILSYRGYKEIRSLDPAPQRRLREYVLRTKDRAFEPQDPALVCKYKLYDREQGGWDPEWKAVGFVQGGEGSLKIYVGEMSERYTIRIMIQDSQQRIWQSPEDLPFGVTPVYLNRATGTG
jgi:hypothetical protein